MQDHAVYRLTPHGWELVDETSNADKLPARHSPDFRSVHWYGNDYTFSPKQAACVRVLWEAWENKTPQVAAGTLLEKAGVGDRQRLRDVFRENVAWGKMIVRGSYQDAYMLLEPPEKT